MRSKYIEFIFSAWKIIPSEICDEVNFQALFLVQILLESDW